MQRHEGERLLAGLDADPVLELAYARFQVGELGVQGPVQLRVLGRLLQKYTLRGAVLKLVVFRFSLASPID